AYEITRRDWSSDVCSSDLIPHRRQGIEEHAGVAAAACFFDDADRQRAAGTEAAKIGTDVEALHLAGDLADVAQRNAAGDCLAAARDEDALVECGERGQLFVEVLEREIDADAPCVLA